MSICPGYYSPIVLSVTKAQRSHHFSCCMRGMPDCQERSTKKSPYMVDLDDYKTELMTSLTEEWETAGMSIRKTQKKQRTKVPESNPFNQGTE